MISVLCGVLPFSCCDPGEARTLDPLIKSQLLYQLSYGVIAFLSNCAAKLGGIFELTKFYGKFF